MNVRVVTAPTAEPLALADAKLHLRVDQTTEDSLINALIVVARQYAENVTRRVFVQRTLELLLPNFYTNCNISNSIEMPYPPLISVSSVKYLDLDGVLQTVSAADYQVDIYREPALIKPAYLSTWPVTTRTDFNAVQIQYVAGYAPSGSPVADWTMLTELEALRQWMKIRVAQMYAYREAIVTGTIVAELKHDYVDGLLDAYCVSVF